MKNLRIAVVYTGMPLNLLETVESEIRKALAGHNVTMLTFGDPGIIADVVKDGRVTREPAQRLVALFMAAASQGADIVVNACSSVGDVAEAAKPLFEQMGIPLVRIDEFMAQTAVKAHKRIGVIATLPTTLDPTKRLLQKAADDASHTVTLVDALADKAFGKPPQEMTELIIEKAQSIKNEVDCLVLAQGSMAGSAEAIKAATGLPVYASPAYGAAAVAKEVN